MFRSAVIYTLAALLVVTTTPAFACTGISLMSEDGAAIRGRTLEFGFPLHSDVLVVPAGKEFTATLPDGGKGMTYETRYDVIGANGVDSIFIIDGMNDQGLSIGLFYFPGYTEYATATEENASRALASQDFGLWLLGNFATIDEVKSAVKDVVMVPTPLPGFGSTDGIALDLHFFVQDKTGKSIAIEPRGGVLEVIDAPLGVMTNSPTYDWHMTNLSNYLNLTVSDLPSEKLGPLTLESFGPGAGLHGIPGDFYSPSRFVRAAILSQNATPNANAEDAVFSAFHILNQFDIPKGAVLNDVIGKPEQEITEWTTVSDLENLRWYFRTSQDPAIRVVDLKGAIAAADGEISVIEMGSTRTVENVSAKVESMK